MIEEVLYRLYEISSGRHLVTLDSSRTVTGPPPSARGSLTTRAIATGQ